MFLVSLLANVSLKQCNGLLLVNLINVYAQQHYKYYNLIYDAKSTVAVENKPPVSSNLVK